MNIVKRMKNSKLVGLDEISSRVLKLTIIWYSFNTYSFYTYITILSNNTYHVALLVFKIQHDLAPNYLKAILLFTSNSRYELRSGSHVTLAQPIKKSYYPNLYLQSRSAPIWNNILDHTKYSITVNTCKSMYIWNR